VPEPVIFQAVRTAAAAIGLPRAETLLACRKGPCLNDSGVPRTFPHETVLSRAREFLAFRAHRLWQACLPLAFFEEAVERGTSQLLAVLANGFACARFLRNCRADRQGRNYDGEENSFHGLLSHSLGSGPRQMRPKRYHTRPRQYHGQRNSPQALLVGSTSVTGILVLDDLWIVVIILEQPAYALVVPSGPIRFGLLILLPQVLPQNKIKLISSEKKLPQLFDFIWSHGTGYPAERYQKATMSIRPCRGHAFAELGDNQ
jgi:hypothetical protein